MNLFDALKLQKDLLDGIIIDEDPMKYLKNTSVKKEHFDSTEVEKKIVSEDYVRSQMNKSGRKIRKVGD